MADYPTDAYFRLRDVINSLLGPGGCPWDQEQTPESLCDYIIEEAFELVAAVRKGDAPEAMEEMGDLMFLLLFMARLYADQKKFGLEDAMACTAEKMIRRHPHVFAGAEVKSRAELLHKWEEIKRDEKTGEQLFPEGAFGGLPPILPPLLKAYRIHSKAARMGFTWATDQEAEEQLELEWKEWRAALEGGSRSARMDEFGDYLFTLVEVARRYKIKPNTALDFANLKFLRRFARMEELARARGQEVPDLSLDEQNALWDEVKAGE